MIIIEANNGPRFVNDQAIESVYFDSDKGEVWVTPKEGNKILPAFPTYINVENVRFISQYQPTEYIYKGSSVEQLAKQLEDLCITVDYLRSCYISARQFADALFSLATDHSADHVEKQAILSEIKTYEDKIDKAGTLLHIEKDKQKK
jgi:hypothetical protein